MAINEDLLIAGANGLISFADVGSTLPTDATTALDAAFIDYGAISSDGVTEAPSQTFQSFKPWGQTRKAKNTLTDSGKTFQATFWETNPHVLALYFGLDTVPTVTAGAFDFAEPDTDNPVYKAMVLDSLDGTNHVRIACTKVQRTDRGNVVYSPSGLIGYQMTFDQLGDVHRYYLLDALVDAS